MNINNPLQQLRKYLEPYSKDEIQSLVMNMASNDTQFCEQMINNLSIDKKWCKLFVHGLNFTTSKESLEKFYTQYGTVKEAVVLVDKKGNSKGFGFVTFSTSAEALDAVKMDKKKIDGRLTHCNLAFKGNPKKFFVGLSANSTNTSTPNSSNPHTLAVSPKARLDASDRRLFVHSLAWKTDDHSLAEAFGTYGELQEAVVIKDKKTGKSRGFGFVTFCSANAAINALLHPNKKIDGRQTHCNLASERSNSNSNTDKYKNGMYNNVQNVFQQSPMNRMMPNIGIGGLNMLNGYPNMNMNNIMRTNSDPFFNGNHGSFAAFPQMMTPTMSVIGSNHIPQYPPPNISSVVPNINMSSMSMHQSIQTMPMSMSMSTMPMNSLLSPQGMNGNPLMNQLLNSVANPAMPIPVTSSMPNYNPLMQWTPSRTRSDQPLMIEDIAGLPMMPGLPNMPAIPLLGNSQSFNSIGFQSPFLNSGVLSPSQMNGSNGHLDKKIVSAGITSDHYPMFNKRQTPLTTANLNMFDSMNGNSMNGVNMNMYGFGGGRERFRPTITINNVEHINAQMMVTSPIGLRVNTNASIANILHTHTNGISPKTQHSDDDRK